MGGAVDMVKIFYCLFGGAAQGEKAIGLVLLAYLLPLEVEVGDNRCGRRKASSRPGWTRGS